MDSRGGLILPMALIGQSREVRVVDRALLLSANHLLRKQGFKTYVGNDVLRR